MYAVIMHPIEQLHQCRSGQIRCGRLRIGRYHANTLRVPVAASLELDVCVVLL